MPGNIADPFILGSDAAGWVDLPVLGDVETELVASVAETQALSGKVTRNSHGQRRTWTLSLSRTLSPATYQKIMDLWLLKPGPHWFYDGTRPNLLAPNNRLMRDWVDLNGVSVGSPANGSLTFTPGKFIQTSRYDLPDRSKLIPIKPNIEYEFGADLNNATSMYIDTYDKNCVRLRDHTATFVAAPDEFYAVMGLNITGTIKDPYLSPKIYRGDFVKTGTGPKAFKSVRIDSVSEVHHTLTSKSLVITLTEI